MEISVVYPMDPVGPRIGGIGTFLKGFVKYAPHDFSIRWVGITCDKTLRPPQRWQEVSVGDRTIQLFPVHVVEDENALSLIPITLRFTASLWFCQSRLQIERSYFLFDRIDPALAFRRTSNKKVLLVHGNMEDLRNPYSEVRWRHFPWLYFLLERYLLTGIDRVFAVSEDAVRQYRLRFPQLKERFSFIPTWVDDQIFFPEEDRNKRTSVRSSYGFKGEDKVVLYVGRLEGAKNPSLLLDTFEWIHKRNSAVKLVIVGSGSLQKRMMGEVGSRNLSSQITFTGSLPQAAVADLYRISDALLLTSAFEGMPRAVLEALACGIPVITTAVGEVRRVVTDGVSGRIVKEHTPEALGDAVESVLRVPSEYSAVNCISSISGFKAAHVLAPLYETYRSFAENHP